MIGSLTDVTGLLVGHHRRAGAGWLTGTTVVLAPSGATAGVDVRGGAPGTRETDLLHPENLVQQVHAVCLTGGSAFGLAAADGVMSWLASNDIGYPVGTVAGEVVPIVPAAVIFDLGRGGRFTNRPDASFGWKASAAARVSTRAQGNVGAGTGAVTAGIKGGLGMASTVLSDGTTVAALAVVNAAGSVIDPGTGLPYEPAGFERLLRRPSAADRRRLRDHRASLAPPLNTTIGVIATDAPLSKADCTRLAGAAQDGLARSARPAHLLVDGDAVFALSTAPPSVVVIGDDERFGDAQGRVAWLNQLLGAAADCFARAVTAGVVHATSARAIPAYRDLCPSAFR
ncbi:MAG: P1 family peptidase [Acidimicrobiia bacterium]